MGTRLQTPYRWLHLIQRRAKFRRLLDRSNGRTCHNWIRSQLWYRGSADLVSSRRSTQRSQGLALYAGRTDAHLPTDLGWRKMLSWSLLIGTIPLPLPQWPILCKGQYPYRSRPCLLQQAICRTSNLHLWLLHLRQQLRLQQQTWVWKDNGVQGLQVNHLGRTQPSWSFH